MVIMFDQLKKKATKEKIKSIVVYENDRFLFEYYKNNKQKESLHKINSCTKSVMSILFGIAFKQGLFSDLQTPVSTFFPTIFSQQEDVRKKNITIEHLLTMSAGFYFPEFGEWNSFAPMAYHHDIVKFVVDQPLEANPGEKMNYNSGCSHILSAILQQISGKTSEQFAKEFLFKPLGIEEYMWYSDKKGISKGADGLVLKVSDMIKIGQLMLNNGVYNQKALLSSEWVVESTKPRYITYENIGHYGYHWWTDQLNEQEAYYFALGFGGQYIFVLPSRNIVIVMTSDMYDSSLKPKRIIQEMLFTQLI